MNELGIGRSVISTAVRTPSASPSADAAYLRQLLERQPGCLIRVRRDGLFLACNDAALGLFDVDALGAILNTNLTDRLVATDRGDWQEFANRVWTSGAASVEYHLALPDGTNRTVLFQGIAINDHPDGVDSLLLSLRDTSLAHRLETSLQTEEISRESQEGRQKEAREQLEQALADHQQLVAQIEEYRAERQRLTAALDAQIADRQAGEAQYRSRCAEFDAGQKGRFEQLERALAERQQLAVQIEGLQAERLRLTAALDAQIADRQEREAEYRHKCAVLETGQKGRFEQLEHALAERQQLAAQIEGFQAERRRLTAALDAHVAERQAREAEYREKSGALEAGQKAKREQLEQALADRQHLAAQIEEFRAERQRLTAALDAQVAERQAREAEYREKSGALEAGQKTKREQLEQALADRQHLAAQIEEFRAERQRLTAALDAQIADRQAREAEYREKSAELERRAEEGQLAFLTREHQTRDRIDGLEAELATSIAEQGRLANAYEQQLHAGHEALGSHEQHRQELADLELRLQAATAEQARLLALVAEHEARRENLDAEHRAAVDSLEQSLARARGESARSIEHAHQAVSELGSELSHALAEQSRLSGLIEEREREQARIDAEHRRALADLETSHGDALAECERVMTGEHEQVRQQNERQRFEIADLKKRHAEALTEQQRLSDLVRERESQQERMDADHGRTIADIEARHHEALAKATPAWQDEREKIREQIEQQIRQQSDDQQREIGHLKEAQDKSVAEQRRLSELLRQAETERRQIEAGRAADRAEIERRFAGAMNQSLAERESANRERIASLQLELGQAVSDQMRLQTLVAQGEGRQRRVVAEYAADRAQAERALGEAIFKKNKVLKALADQRVELQRWQDAATELEPLAAAGRLAAEVAGELHEVLRHVDEQAKFVLTLCSSEAVPRAEIETLRADALRAASLARQFVLSKARQLEVPFPAEPAYVRLSADTPDDPSEDS